MPIFWYDGTVVKIEQNNPHLRRFWVSLPESLDFSFQAGQFVTMDLPIGDKRLQRWRSYSIANAPTQDKLLEFCIVRSREGAGTRYLFEEVQTGATLRFKGPDGAFVLPERIETDLVFVCTGTGIAPFRSMLLDLYRSGKSHRHLHLIFGARTEADILYREEFEDLQQKWPHFRYDIVLSRAPEWPGYQGHVHQVYLQTYADKRPDLDFYLCGWSNMIDEAVANLMLKLGYERRQIHYELYG